MAILNHTIKRLIIADDDVDDQMLIREAIENYALPIEIGVASDGIRLMKQLESEQLPDVVLLDLNMPNKTGLECLKEIKSSTRFRHISVVVLSTSKGMHDIEACFTSGAQLFFTKPCTFDALKNMMHAILSVDWEKFPASLSRQEFFRIAAQSKPAFNLEYV